MGATDPLREEGKETGAYPKEARDSEAKYKPEKFQGSTICDSNHCSDAKGHAYP